MENIIPGVLLQVFKQEKLWNLTLKIHFPEVIYKELNSKMEIIAFGSNLPIILDYVFPDGSKWSFFSLSISMWVSRVGTFIPLNCSSDRATAFWGKKLLRKKYNLRWNIWCWGFFWKYENGKNFEIQP